MGIEEKAMSFDESSSSEDTDSSIPWFDDRQKELFIRSVPKVELHIHLDGSFSPKELWEYLQQNPHLIQCIPVEKKLPWETNPNAPPFKLRELVSVCKTDQDYTRLCTCRRRYRKTRHVEERKKSMRKKVGTLEDMLLCFQFFTPIVYNNFDLLEHLAFDFVQRQKEQNVVYTEVRYSPHLLAEDPRKAYHAITKGLRRGCEEASALGGICFINQILCGINFQPDWSADVIDMANEFRHDFPCAVVGIDVAAGESHFSPDSPFHKGHLDMCRKAVSLGVPITLHAGETPDSERNVGAAILDYGASRIGHGYRISNQDNVIALAKSKNIHFENCPTSSVVSFVESCGRGRQRARNQQYTITHKIVNNCLKFNQSLFSSLHSISDIGNWCLGQNEMDRASDDRIQRKRTEVVDQFRWSCCF